MRPAASVEREGPRARPDAKVAYRIPRVKGQTRDLRGARARRRARARHGPHRRARDAALRRRPTAPAARRRIVALVEQDGLPRKRLTVATLQGAGAGQAGRAGA